MQEFSSGGAIITLLFCAFFYSSSSVFWSMEHTGLNSPLRCLTALGHSSSGASFDQAQLHINKILLVPAPEQGCSPALFHLQTWGGLASKDPTCAESTLDFQGLHGKASKQSLSEPGAVMVPATRCANLMGMFLCQHLKWSSPAMSPGTGTSHTTGVRLTAT